MLQRLSSKRNKFDNKPAAPRQVKGFTAVPPPKNEARRRLLADEDIATSGGARTVHGQAASAR